MTNDDPLWAEAAARRMTELAEAETQAPDWLRQVLRRLATTPSAFRIQESATESEINTFIYFH